MSNILPNLGLFGDIQNCEDGILDKINKNFETLDTVVYIGFENFVANAAALPGTAPTGTKYIASDTGTIYVFTDQWVPYVPQPGYISFDKAQNKVFVYNGTAWVDFGAFISAINIGTGEQAFASVNGLGQLEFKTFKSGPGILLSSTSTEIVIGLDNAGGGLPINWYPDPLALTISNVVDDPTVGVNPYPANLKTIGPPDNDLTQSAYIIDSNISFGFEEDLPIAAYYFECDIPPSLLTVPNDPKQRTVVFFHMEGSPSWTTVSNVSRTKLELQQLDSLGAVIESETIGQNANDKTLYYAFFNLNVATEKIRIYQEYRTQFS